MANFQKIRDLLSRRNMQMKEFAQIIGMSDAGLQDLLKRNSTKTDTIERIAKVLNVPVGFFFDEIKTSETNIEEKASIKGGDQNVIGNNNFTLIVHNKADIPLLEQENENLKQKIEGLMRELKGKDDMLKAKDDIIRSKDEIIGMLRELGKR